MNKPLYAHNVVSTSIQRQKRWSDAVWTLKRRRVRILGQLLKVTVSLGKSSLFLLLNWFFKLHLFYQTTVAPTPLPFPWVRDVEVSEDLTVSLYPTGCTTDPFPELQINGWTASGNTFTSGSDSVTVTKQTSPASGSGGTFNLKITDKKGAEHVIEGMIWVIL